MNNEATTVKEVLTAMEWLLVNVGWCQDELYYDKEGAYLEPSVARDNPSIIGSMCLVGACCLVDTSPDLRMLTRELLRQAAGDPYLGKFNDTHSKEEVLAVVRKAKETHHELQLLFVCGS